MRRAFFTLALTATCLAIVAGDLKSTGNVPLPPLSKGGIASLWYREHTFIQEEYGDFKLLDYDNCSFPVEKERVARSTWKLVAMGNFVSEKSVQYATLARVANQPEGVLLIMFEWVDPADTSRPHGVFHHTFVGQESLLIRTKQASEGWVDTLEFSCSDLDRVCGKAYYNTANGAISLAIVDMDTPKKPKPPAAVEVDEDEGW
jgi:hypothetical protein